MLIRGQERPSGRISDDGWVPSVHGQPAFAGGAGGTARVGHRMPVPVVNNSPIPREVALDLLVQIETLADIAHRMLAQQASRLSVGEQPDDSLGRRACVSGRNQNPRGVLQSPGRLRAQASTAADLICSGIPPTSAATTGVPHARASRMVFGNVSARAACR